MEENETVKYTDVAHYFYGLRPMLWEMRAPRKLQIRRKEPSFSIEDNAIFTPSSRHTKPFDGCVYNQEKKRLKHSCVIRDVRDNVLSTEPSIYPGEPSSLQRLHGRYIYLGHINPHFGHFILESFSSLWILKESLGEVAGYVAHLHDEELLHKPFVRRCLRSAGIDDQKPIYHGESFLIDELVVPEPSFQLDSHAYRAYRRVCESVADSVGAGGCKVSDRPVYLSRSKLASGVTRYLGEDIIEAHLAANGVRIVHPQEISFEDQIRTINQHSTIIGIAGSAMHNVVFSVNRPRVIYLTPPWINPSCLLIDKCFDLPSIYVQSCTVRESAKSYLDRISERVPGLVKSRGKDFVKTHKLDHAKVLRCLNELAVF